MSLDLSSNYFAIFGLPEVFDFDQILLKENFRGLQSRYHPDKFVNASDQKRRESVQAAAFINEAYETLKAPVKRVEYLLLLAGDDTDFERFTSSDTGFLMIQLGYREELESLASLSDPLAAVDRFRVRMKQEMSQIFDGFNRALETRDMPVARNAVSKLKFYQKLMLQLDTVEASIEDALF